MLKYLVHSFSINIYGAWQRLWRWCTEMACITSLFEGGLWLTRMSRIATTLVAVHALVVTSRVFCGACGHCGGDDDVCVVGGWGGGGVAHNYIYILIKLTKATFIILSCTSRAIPITAGQPFETTIGVIRLTRTKSSDTLSIKLPKQKQYRCLTRLQSHMRNRKGRQGSCIVRGHYPALTVPLPTSVIYLEYILFLSLSFSPCPHSPSPPLLRPLLPPTHPPFHCAAYVQEIDLDYARMC